MRILMLSWEYPPRIVGGISRVVHDLAQKLARKGNEVHVVTYSEDNSPLYEKDEEVFVHRVHNYNIGANNFLDSVMHMNFSLLEKACELVTKHKFDIIHAHDWLVAYAAKTLKQAFKIPLVSTIHATEHGRNNGLHNDMQRYISSMEWLLTYESWRVICNSEYMKNETRNIFQLPEDKIKVINNGVQLDKFEGVERNYDFRRRFASDNEKIIFFVGRLVQEKGVQVLLDAAPKITSNYHDVKFVIAGKGPQLEYLRYKASEMGIAQKFYFTGYISDEDLSKLYKCADIAVFPSLYEPFGIVALEGMVANVPVVVTDTCGLGEIVEHGVDGMKAYTGNANSLADCILELLFNNQLVENIKANAIKKVHAMYNWDKISSETLETYKEVIALDNSNKGIIEEKPAKRKTKSTEEAKTMKTSTSSSKVTKKLSASKKSTGADNTTQKVTDTEAIAVEELIIKTRSPKMDTAELN